MMFWLFLALIISFVVWAILMGVEVSRVCREFDRAHEINMETIRIYEDQRRRLGGR